MKILYPVKQVKVSQPFGFDNTNHNQRANFYSVFDNKHPGIDFDVAVGTEVYSSFEGVVVRKEFHKGMGNVVGVRNGNIVALYAHLSSTNVELEHIVMANQLIGLSGDTGNACLTSHLHFELRDISKTNLKDMVFQPCFNEELDNYKNTFQYTVNNKNTNKTLKTLSKLYFGTENNWNLIKNANNLDFDSDYLLKEGLSITIPNYNQ